MTAELILISLAVIVIGVGTVAFLLRKAAGRRPTGKTETILQVDAENRSVFSKQRHEQWDGEVRITRPTDPHIVKQIQQLNDQE